jgi:hypothetical protein
LPGRNAAITATGLAPPIARGENTLRIGFDRLFTLFAVLPTGAVMLGVFAGSSPTTRRCCACAR